MKNSSDFDHEIMNLVEKNVGTPAILGRALGVCCTSRKNRLNFIHFRDLTYFKQDTRDFQKSLISAQRHQMLSSCPFLNSPFWLTCGEPIRSCGGVRRWQWRSSLAAAFVVGSGVRRWQRRLLADHVLQPLDGFHSKNAPDFFSFSRFDVF
jgi:hypothetical protein